MARMVRSLLQYEARPVAACLVILLLGLTSLVAVRAESTWRLLFPGSARPETNIHYSLQHDGRWHFRGLLAARPVGASVVIDTEVEGRPATAVRAVVLGATNFPAAIERALLPGATVEDVITSAEAARVTVRGRLVESTISEPTILQVTYHAIWAASFLHIVDGAAPSTVVGRAAVAPDGAFTLSLPDLRRAKLVMSYAESDRGYFRLRLQAASGSGPWIRLRRAAGVGQELALPAASEYGDLVVTPFADVRRE